MRLLLELLFLTLAEAPDLVVDLVRGFTSVLNIDDVSLSLPWRDELLPLAVAPAPLIPSELRDFEADLERMLFLIVELRGPARSVAELCLLFAVEALACGMYMTTGVRVWALS